MGRRFHVVRLLALAASALPGGAQASSITQNHWWVVELGGANYGLSELTIHGPASSQTVTTIHFNDRVLDVAQPISVVAGGGVVLTTTLAVALASLTRLRRKRASPES